MCRECGRGGVHRPPDQGPGSPPATLNGANYRLLAATVADVRDPVSCMPGVRLMT